MNTGIDMTAFDNDLRRSRERSEKVVSDMRHSLRQVAELGVRVALEFTKQVYQSYIIAIEETQTILNINPATSKITQTEKEEKLRKQLLKLKGLRK